jgi:hypothetical protein
VPSMAEKLFAESLDPVSVGDFHPWLSAPGGEGAYYIQNCIPGEERFQRFLGIWEFSSPHIVKKWVKR